MGILTKIGAVLLKVKGAVLATTATKIATVTVAAAVVVGGTVGAVQAEVFASPEKKVEKALESLTENEESVLSALFGIREFFGDIVKKGADASVEVKLEDVPLDELGLSGISIPNIGIGFSCRYDAKKEQAEMTAGAKVADTTLLSANLYADKEKLMVSVPQLFAGHIGANYADAEFAEQFKNSELAAMLGEEITAMAERFVAELDKEISKEEIGDAVELLAALKKSKDELFESMEAEKDGEAIVQVQGEEVTCKVYKATFGPEEVKAFLQVLIDEAMAMYEETLTNETENQDAAVLEEIAAYKEELLAQAEELKSVIQEEIAETKLYIYLNGKRLVMADVEVCLKEQALNLNALFGMEGNRYDNMKLTLSVIMEDGVPETLFELVHETKNEETLSSCWRVLVEEEEVFKTEFSYEKEFGDFTFAILIPEEYFAFSVEGVLTVPVKGKEFVFELNDISVTEFDEKISLGFKTKLHCKVFEGEITAPEEMKWNVATMGATEWTDISSEISKNIYSLIMKLMFSN